MNQFKIGDRVRAVKDCNSNYFRKGEIGTVVEIYDKNIIVDFGYYRQHVAYFDETELIESEPNQSVPKPFPWIGEAIDDLKDNLFGINTEQFETIYNYFAQFGKQPSRLEQLKAKHPNLTQDEQTELIDLLLT